MLIWTSTPCKKCEWVMLPGLWSHLALLFELHFDAQYLRPADPTCRQFNFRSTSEDALAQAAALVSIGLFWCTGAQWLPDAVLFLYWDLIRQCVRKRVSIHSVTEEAAKVASAARGQQQGIEASVQSWWSKQRDAACVASHHLEANKLQDTNITSTTSRVLRLKSQKFQTVQEISPDGQTFPTQPMEFKAKMLKQAQEMYANRPGITVDTAQILKATAKTPLSPLQDHPGFAALMYMCKRSTEGVPWDDVAGQAPTLDVFVDMLHRSGSGATSREEMPRSLVLKLTGAAWHTLVQLLSDLDAGTDSQWWQMVIQLCLIKKFPTWLLKTAGLYCWKLSSAVCPQRTFFTGCRSDQKWQG